MFMSGHKVKERSPPVLEKPHHFTDEELLMFKYVWGRNYVEKLWTIAKRVEDTHRREIENLNAKNEAREEAIAQTQNKIMDEHSEYGCGYYQWRFLKRVYDFMRRIAYGRDVSVK